MLTRYLSRRTHTIGRFPVLYTIESLTARVFKDESTSGDLAM